MNSEACYQFDAYLIVDWSANNKPKRGKDSIWYCLLERLNGKTRFTRIENPSTRMIAFEQIRGHLVDLAARRRATLLGFDFPYGYPRGFARALNITSVQPWRHIWDLLHSWVVDDARNRSNRFEVAARLNASIGDQPFPFWGCPASQERPNLKASHTVRHGADGLPEFRVTEKRTHGPQPVWKLCYSGSVGSQTLVGIPYLARLRSDPQLKSCSRVWPFETGFRLATRDERDWTVLHAEIYPSLNSPNSKQQECKDEAQVRGVAEYFASRDEVGNLGGLFATPQGISNQELLQIQAEEGWILGVA